MAAPNTASHTITGISMHPIPGKPRRGWRGGSLRVFGQFAWLGVGSGKMALSRPAHQRVTHTVRHTEAELVSAHRSPSIRLLDRNQK